MAPICCCPYLSTPASGIDAPAVVRSHAYCARMPEIFPCDDAPIADTHPPTQRSDVQRAEPLDAGEDTRRAPDVPRAARILSLDALGRNPLAVAEHELVVQALQKAGGDRERAAKLLGVSRWSLQRKLERSYTLLCEEQALLHAEFVYPELTAFCRRHQISYEVFRRFGARRSRVP
jgi:hypothetical protein